MIQEEEEEVSVGYRKPRERLTGGEGLFVNTKDQWLLKEEELLKDLSLRKDVHIPWEIPFPPPQSLLSQAVLGDICAGRTSQVGQE